MNYTITNKDDRLRGVVIAMMTLLPALNYFINNLAVQSFGATLPISLVFYTLLLLFELYAIIGIRQTNRDARNISLLALFMTFLSYVLYHEKIGSVLITPDWNPIESQALFFVLFCLPAFIICSSVNDWRYVKKPFSILSPLVVLLGFYAFYKQGFSVYGDGKMNYMSLSYFILTSSCFCFFFFIDKMRWLYGVFSFVGLFVILAAGCRGALLCYLIFAILLIIRQVTVAPKTKYTHLFQVVLIILVFFVISSSVFSIQFINNWFDALGISSRAVEMINEGTFLEDNSRELIRSSVLKGIMENPMGYGLFGDRFITSNYYIGGVEYAHNIIFELLADFGFIGLALFLIYFFKTTFSFYKKFKRDYMWVFFLLFVPEGLIKLFFSSSFLLDVEFWIILALLINRNKIDELHSI